MRTLQDLEDNPQKFWIKREQELKKKGVLLTHTEFCQRYVKEAKREIYQSVEDAIVCNEHDEDDAPWYQKDLEAIERIIKEKIPSDHPAFPSATALYYGCACDDIERAYKDPILQDILKTQDHLRADIDKFLKTSGKETSHDLNRKQFWSVSDDGQFSLLDSLIMRRKGLHLCAAPQTCNRHRFSAHRTMMGWSGVIAHDNTHSCKNHRHAQNLDNLGISFKEYFNTCCNPETLIKGNIIHLSQQIQSLFYNFHELPSVNQSYDPHNPESAVFPRTKNLTDLGFLAVTPFFMQDMPHHTSWRTHPIQRAQMVSSNNVHKALLRWRDIHCTSGWDFLAKVSKASPTAKTF